MKPKGIGFLIVFPSNGECNQPTLLPLNIQSKDLIRIIIVFFISFPERAVQIDINNVMKKQVAVYYIFRPGSQKENLS